MIDIIKAADRHFSDMGWLQTYWLFSFSSYYDPGNIHHGRLRVFNDDIVQPGKGFGEHPHEEMEIVSIVLQGEMTHRDSMGNISVIRGGDVQRMTAGTGLTHSEWNNGREPVHFLQIWIIPETSGLQPSYDQRGFIPDCWHNNLKLIASGNAETDTVFLNANARLFRSRLDAGETILYQADAGRCVFLYMIDGRATLEDKEIEKGDQVRIHDRKKLVITSSESADLILVDIGER